MAEYLVVYWKDIPCSVEARQGDTSVRVPLSAKFQHLVDHVAMQQGLTSDNDYLSHWTKQSGETRGGDPHAVAKEVAAELESQFDEIRSRYAKQTLY